MGCPGGHLLTIYSRFRAKRELHCIFLGKKAIIITSKHGTTIFFSHYNLFSKLKHKFARKARVYILSEYIGSCCVLNKFNMVTVSVRKCITVTGQFSSRGSKSLVQQLKTFSQPGDPTLNNPQTKLNRQ